MKKIILTVAVIFTAATISLACGEEKKACCKKGDKKECSKDGKKACASKDQKSCAKASSCCKKKAGAEHTAPEASPASITPAK